jgi:hypothetical protein
LHRVTPILKETAERFIAGVTKPARPSTPEAETNPHQYDGPPRTAEQVAA